jgi:ABC-type uncharacterized transport system substrate-binding protein
LRAQARFHQGHSRLGGGVAIRRARAIHCISGYWVHSQWIGFAEHPHSGRLHDGLGETGHVAGQNVTIEYRWADGQFDRLPALAADLVGRRVAVLAAFAPPTALAAKSATTTTPIVVFVGGDPVKLGLVASFSRPGGNITGVGGLTIELVSKRLEILRELVPKADSIAFLVNPSNPTSATQIENMQEASRALGLRLHIYRATSEHEVNAAFAEISGASRTSCRRCRFVFHHFARSDCRTGGPLQHSYDL